MNVVKSDEVGISSSSNCENKTGKRSFPSKNLNGAPGNLTFEAKLVFIQSRKGFIKAPIL